MFNRIRACWLGAVDWPHQVLPICASDKTRTLWVSASMISVSRGVSELGIAGYESLLILSESRSALIGLRGTDKCWHVRHCSSSWLCVGEVLGTAQDRGGHFTVLQEAGTVHRSMLHGRAKPVKWSNEQPSEARPETVGKGERSADCGWERKCSAPAAPMPGAFISKRKPEHLARGSQAGGTAQVLSVTRKTWGRLEGRWP